MSFSSQCCLIAFAVFGLLFHLAKSPAAMGIISKARIALLAFFVTLSFGGIIRLIVVIKT